MIICLVFRIPHKTFKNLCKLIFSTGFIHTYPFFNSLELIGQKEIMINVL